jgi:hypothetical protein
MTFFDSYNTSPTMSPLEEYIRDHSDIEMIKNHPKFRKDLALLYASEYGYFELVK